MAAQACNQLAHLGCFSRDAGQLRLKVGELCIQVRHADELSYREDRGYWPGKSLHSCGKTMRATFGEDNRATLEL